MSTKQIMLTFANKITYELMIVSGKEFRARQGKYIGAAFSGEDVVVKSRRGNFRIIPIPAVDNCMSENPDLDQLLSSALTEVKDSMDGKKQLLTWEEMLNELDN